MEGGSGKVVAELQRLEAQMELLRATVAAGWLASRGFAKLDVDLGSMGAWNAAGPTPA